MNPKNELLLATAGWTLECQSPLELRHEDGSFATGQAALLVVADVCQDDASQVCVQESAQLAAFVELADKVQWLTQTMESAQALTRGEDETYWKEAFSLIFSERGSIRINALLDTLGVSTDWADPDSSYEADVRAYVSGMQEKLLALQALLGEENPL